MNPRELAKRTARRALERSGRGRAYLQARRDRLESSQRERGVSFYRDFVGAGDLCFDIGANVGNRTVLFREIGARVVAVEPQGTCVKRLAERFGEDPDVAIVPSALGGHTGTAEIAICEEDPTISTMSERWQSEGRFADRTWSRRESVPVTTLDLLIEEHGAPSFCKIDVEGFEIEVLRGLSAPVRCVSFEFTHEFLGTARECVEHLASLGPIAASASFGETMELATDWIPPDRLFSTIEQQPDHLDWGDIYVRSEI